MKKINVKYLKENIMENPKIWLDYLLKISNYDDRPLNTD
jgi:hypothetical protein